MRGARIPVVLAAACGLLGPALTVADDAAGDGAVTVTPVGKVVELLGLLLKELSEDGTKDKAAHEKYTKYYTKSKGETERVISETTNKIESLKSSLELGKAFREGKQSALEKAAGEQAAAEKDLKDASDRREKERKSFVSAEAELSQAANQFERALEVLAKKSGGAAALLDSGSDAAAGAATSGKASSFLSAAKRLRSSLEQDADFAMTEGQRESLDALVRLAAEKAAAAMEASADASPVADFLQVEVKAHSADEAAGPYGDYQSQSGSVTSTLQSVLDKTQGHLESARKGEATARSLFKKLKEGLEAEIKNKGQTVADLKVAISRSQEESGQLQSQLLAAQQLLKVTQEQLAELEADFKTQDKAFKKRSAMREEEVLAVTDAQRILKQGKDKGTLALDEESDDAAVSFVQMASESSASAALRNVLSDHEAAEDGVALVSTKSTHKRRYSMRRRSSDSADPFGKVKSMVRSMLRKLSEQQAQDQTKAQWCDAEMAKSTKSKEARQTDVQKLKDRTEEMKANLAQLKDDIKNLEKDLGEMRKATAEATKIRMAAAKQAKASLAQYKDAAKLIRSAMTVLTKFYGQKAKAQAAADASAKDKSGFKANGKGNGVIGILEVAEANYKKLEEDLSLTEKTEAKTFNDLINESQVREAVFLKDFEYKNRARVKLEGDLIRAGNDLKSYQKELEAVVSYLEQLKSTCTVKGDSYDERQARRDKELTSLRDALKFLNGDGI